MLITSEHKKLSKYLLLNCYLISGLLSGIGFVVYFTKSKLIGIIFIIAFVINFFYSLMLILKETKQNPKNIEVLSFEIITPKTIYILWGVFLLIVITVLGSTTFSIIFSILLR